MPSECGFGGHGSHGAAAFEGGGAEAQQGLNQAWERKNLKMPCRLEE